MSTKPTKNLQTIASKQSFNKLLAEWTQGEKMSLTDEELDQLLDYFQKLSDALDFVPPSYKLMRSDCWRRLDELKGFKDARQSRKEVCS